jgi:hypothetical protein
MAKMSLGTEGIKWEQGATNRSWWATEGDKKGQSEGCQIRNSGNRGTMAKPSVPVDLATLWYIGLVDESTYSDWFLISKLQKPRLLIR